MKGGRNTPSKGLRLGLLRSQEVHPEVWRERYKGPRALHESAYHALKAVVGDVLPGRTKRMQDRYRDLKYFAFDLYGLARDHLEEILSSRWRRIPTDPRSRRPEAHAPRPHGGSGSADLPREGPWIPSAVPYGGMDDGGRLEGPGPRLRRTAVQVLRVPRVDRERFVWREEPIR